MCGLLSLCTEQGPVMCLIGCCRVNHQSGVMLSGVAVEVCKMVRRAKRHAGDGSKHQRLLVPRELRQYCFSIWRVDPCCAEASYDGAH